MDATPLPIVVRTPIVLVSKVEPPPSVVVTVDANAWHATYKGQSTSWPRTTTATDVERMAGEWGRSVDAKSVSSYPPISVLSRPVLSVGGS